MELSTIEETEQPLFGRTRLTLQATFEASVPSRGVVTQRICEDRDVKPDVVVIRSITSRFGGGIATVEAYVYENAARLAELESKHHVERTNKTMAQPAEPAESEPEPAPESAEDASEAPVDESLDEK